MPVAFRTTAMSRATQHDTKEVIGWYRDHRTKAKIGWDPDGMCQKICRTARNIGPGAPSALASALSTPEQYRVRKVSEIVPGDVMYFDDPKDSNPFGHIVTATWRDPKLNPNTLRSIAVETNSVKADQIVTVRADYFGVHWGDSFQWGGRWLNGEPFYDLTDPKPKPKPKAPEKWSRIEESIKNLERTDTLLVAAIKAHRKAGHDRYVKALQRDRAALKVTLDRMKASYEKARRG
jgi:hypothetical protein